MTSPRQWFVLLHRPGPAVESEEAARQLAEHDDVSVRDGLPSETVRPWQVVLAPIAD